MDARDRYRFFALALVLLMTACGGARSGPASPPTAPPASAGSAADIEALWRARTDSARMRFTEADVGFVTGMIAHHAQALVMAQLAEPNGASPSVRTLAARIINAQKDEIATMQTWLRDRDQPVPQFRIEGIELTVTGTDHAGHMMPGMLTAAQLRELQAARGAAFDRLFLTGMIAHHQGAVTMVHALFATDGAAQDEAIFKLASDIQVDQITEIARMERMLEALPPAGDAGAAARNRHERVGS